MTKKHAASEAIPSKEKRESAFVFPYGVSVFFPAYNDSPSIPGLIVKTFEVLESQVSDFEVIVVNDGSEDDTGKVLDELSLQMGPRMRVVHHEFNRGYGGALRTGLAAATKEFVFYTDGDGQYDVSELPNLMREVTPAVGLVNGYKIRRQDPRHRILIGWLYNRFARFLFGVRLRDIDCDYRLIRRSILDPQTLTSTSGTICVEMVKKMEMSGMEVVEVPVSHYPRWHGRSQFFRVKALFTTFTQLCRLFVKMVLLPAIGRGK
jgi:glycosyltransferase involved in cell wall biosynthesis